ncbi:GNAT family N-acetyltransferase [Niabella sp. 3A5MI-3]|nr:GNAT family N-acetyltransferase [Niabella beijingensis]
MTNGHRNYYDIGYRLRRDFWGKGYAAVSAAACLRYGFEQLGFQEVFAMAHVENTASNKILRRIGMKAAAPFELEGMPHFWYEQYINDYRATLHPGQGA